MKNAKYKARIVESHTSKQEPQVALEVRCMFGNTCVVSMAKWIVTSPRA